MLRINVNKSAAGAKKYYSEAYYSEGKTANDYYSDKGQSIGIWGGKAAEKLGLVGDVSKDDFASLCDNQIPKTGEQLTERNNAERRVGYDFTFNASKSVSLAYTFGNEENKKDIIKAFRDSVKEAMSEVETGMQSRVRLKAQNENRETGNIAYGEFVHFTSRPIDSIPDPHLHAHCFVFNGTYDDVEQRWKAGEFGQIMKDAPYYEAVFHSCFADRLEALGYSIERAKTGFEIEGISRKTIEKFSRRTEEIEQLAEERNITDNERKSELGARTRESKRESAPDAEIYKNWNERLTGEEWKAIFNLRKTEVAANEKKENQIAKEAVQYSLDHHLERKSVATDKEILTTAIKSSVGDIGYGDIKTAFAKNESIITVKENLQTFITTKEALLEENQMIQKAFATKGKYRPINENYQPKTEKLDDEQLRAISHALTTTDGITIIAGKAGAGKTTLMVEVKQGILEAGKQIHAFAPSADASRGVQRQEGFKNANTVTSLIQNEELQKQLKNQVIWIDEAGTLSNKDMNKLLDIAKHQNARIILTGDTKQHTSVERGDALRIMQQEAGIVPIQVSKIKRQKDELYKQAVSSLSKADIEKGFQKLDKIGAIHEIEDSVERIDKIAEDYFKSAHPKVVQEIPREVLVISPTHAEGDKVTEAIRQKLKQENILGKNEKKFLTFKNIQLTEAEKQKTENYIEGNWLIFHQNATGFRAGSKHEIIGTENNMLLLKDGVTGKLSSSPIENSSRYSVFEPKTISITKGDKIRITGNGYATDGKNLFNGTTFRVAGFDREDGIKLSNGSTIAKDYGQFSMGYVMTSHAAQGKTVDKVIISQSSMSFRASSQEQFYVSVSRGRQAVSIYTDDKADLLLAVSQSSERKSATELTRNKTMDKAIEVTRFDLMKKVKEKALLAIQKIKTSIDKNIHKDI